MRRGRDRLPHARLATFAGSKVLSVGLGRRPLTDLYHFLLTTPWWRLVVLIVLGYVAVNAAFALVYLGLGDVIEHARPGSFADAFFFSVQTMATVGYGNLWPRTLGANLVATAEMITGGLGLAVTTGLVFAKFARPTARVVFSRVAVVRPYEGVPSLMLRMANARAAQIVQAQVSLMLARTERMADGEEVRRMYDLPLRRGHSALFALTWTAIHPIDAASPLAGADARSLADSDAGLVVTLTGFDEVLAATVHARHEYRADEILWGARFADVLGRTPEGRRVIDYRRFHDTVGPGDGGSAPPS